MGSSAAILVRLGFDPTKFNEGLEQAKTNLANFKGKAVLIETQLKTESLRLRTEFTAANRAATAERIADINHELAVTISAKGRAADAEKAALQEHIQNLRQQRAAEVENLSAFNQQIAKVNQLKAAYLEASMAAKKSHAAVGIFSQMSGAPGLTGTLQQLVSSLSMLSPALMPLQGILTKISALSTLGSLPMLGTIKAGGPAFEGGAAAEGTAAAAGGAALGAEGVGAATLARALGGAGIAAGALVAVQALLVIGAASVTKGMMNEAQAINNMSAATGLSTDQVQVYTRLAKEMGVDVGAVTMEFARLEGQLGKYLISGKDADQTTGQFVKILENFGIGIKAAGGGLRPITDILADFADQMQAIQDPTTRTAYIMDALGPRGKVLAQVINQAAAEGKTFRDIMAEIAASGVVIPESQIENLQKAKGAWDEITRGAAAYFVEVREGISQSFLDMTHLQALLDLKPGPKEAQRAAQQKVFSDAAAKPLVPGQEISLESEPIVKAREAIAKTDAANREKLLSIDKRSVDLKRELADLEEKDAQAQAKALMGGTGGQASEEENLKRQDEIKKELGTLDVERNKKIEEYTLKLKAANDELQKAYAWQVKMAEGRLVDAVGERGARAAELKSAQDQFAALQTKGEGLSGADLIANKKQLAELEKVIGELVKATDDATKKLKADNEALTAEIAKQINEEALKNLALDQSLHMIAGRTGLGKPQQPVAPAGAIPLEQFKAPFEQIQNTAALGVVSSQQEVDQLKALRVQLDAELTVRQHNIELATQGTDEWVKQVEQATKLRELLDQINTKTVDVSKNMPIQLLMEGFKGMGETIAKFSGGLGKAISEQFAGVDEVMRAIKNIETMGGTRNASGTMVPNTDFFASIKKITSGEAGQGQAGGNAAANLALVEGGIQAIGGFANTIQGIAKGPGGAQGAFSGALSGASMGAAIGSIIPGIGTAIGAAIGGVGGLVGGIFGSGKAVKKAQDTATAISKAVQKITDALNLGATDLKTAIAQIKAQQVIANNISGKGTKDTKVQLQQQLDQQLNQLQSQQKQILDKFHATLGILQLPEGAQGTAQSIQQIAAALKEAAGAGATAAEQLQFYNLSVQALTTTLGRTLRSDEQGTLDALRQEISLREQRADILKSAADQELAIRQSLGVQRVLTPGQQAAKQIKDIETAKNKQLAALDEQQATLDVQINGQAELYGWSLKDLDVAGAKAKLIAEQLDLTQQITAETIAQIKAQQDYYATLLSGKLPTLPVGTLPSGFSFPTGGTAPTGVGGVTMTVGVINVTLPQFPPLPGSPQLGGGGVGYLLPTPAQIADSMKQAIAIINSRRYAGLE